VIVQARMGSSRLPEKVLLQLGERTVLERVIDRVQHLGPIVVATTLEAADDPIIDLCRHLNISTLRGSSADVLDRYHVAANLYDGDPIIRVTADCPLLDPALIPPLLGLIREGGYDYAGVKGAPRGRHCEAFTREILGAANRWAIKPHDREHVVPWMFRNGLCGWHHVRYPDRRAVELNTQADLRRIRRIAAA